MSATGPLCAFAASVTWVVGSSVYAHLAKRFAPAAINLNRALVALPLFVLASLAQHADVAASLHALGPAVATRGAWLALSICTSYALGDIAFMRAALAIGFPAAQALGALYPLWAAVFGLVALGEPLTARKSAGLALAIVGTIVVVAAGRRKGEVAAEAKGQNGRNGRRRYGAGVALAFVTSLLWAINSFAGARGGVGMNAAFANVLRMSVASVVCATLARRTAAPGARLFFARADYRRFLPFFAIEAFGGSYLYIYGLSHSPIAVGATLSSLAPVVSVPVAIALGWERFSIGATLAVVTVVAGVVLLVS